MRLHDLLHPKSSVNFVRLNRPRQKLTWKENFFKRQLNCAGHRLTIRFWDAHHRLLCRLGPWVIPNFYLFVSHNFVYILCILKNYRRLHHIWLVSTLKNLWMNQLEKRFMSEFFHLYSGVPLALDDGGEYCATFRKPHFFFSPPTVWENNKANCS